MEVVPKSGVLQWNGVRVMSFLFSTLPTKNNALVFSAPLKWVDGVCGFWGVKRWQKNTASNKKAIQKKQ